MFWGEPLLCLRGADEFEAVVGFCGNILGSCPLELRLGNLTWTVNYHPNHSLGLDYLKSMACLQEIVVTTDCTI